MLVQLRVICALTLGVLFSSHAAAAQDCVPGGGGGSVPAAGSGSGSWPNTLPATPFVSTYSVTVPAGATQLDRVELTGLSHAWAGDVQFVLTDPTGSRHNLIHRLGFPGSTFGASCDFAGTYSIRETSGAAWPSPCVDPSDIPSGAYNQAFGNWPSGTNGILNTPLSAIPISSGQWTLTAYDWVNGESGSLTSWQLCFRASTPTNPTEVRVPTLVDSGVLSNPSSSPATVWQHLLQHPGAAWMRAYFSSIQLPPGSVLRLTSLLDAEEQELDRFTAEMWSNGSAYFNGNQILVEIVAAPFTSANRVVIDGVGLETTANCSNAPCGALSPDGRVPSGELWSARWVNGGCTASIYNTTGGFVSAGHCFTPIGTVLAFDVPLSMNDCTMRQPPVRDQFPVIETVRDTPGANCVPDWRVGKIGLNNDGQTHFERYGVFKPLASGPPPVSSTVNIYGYGSSSNRVVNGVQQLTVSQITTVGAGHLSYSGGTTTGGTSGAGVVWNNQIVGINSCCSGAGNGIASRIDQATFVAARQEMFPHTVHAPWDSPFCLNANSVTVPITVCNPSDAADSYLLTFAPVPAGPMCSIAGPTGYTVIGPNPIGPIPSGGCVTVQVQIARPAGLNALNLTSCYDVTATSVAGGLAVTDRGSVQDRRDLCVHQLVNPFDGVVAAVGVNTPVTFAIRNDSVVSGVIPYRFEAFGPSMEPSGAISLDGNYFGVATSGVAMVPLGATGQIVVNVKYRWSEPYDASDLVMSSDVDGDGNFEPLTSTMLRSTSFAAPAVYCTSGVSTNACTASMGFLGVPSASQATPFTLTANGVEGAKQGLFFYSLSPTAGTPWSSGSTSFLCVKSPTRRTPPANSGGSVNQCNGSFALDWNAWMTGSPTGLGTPYVAGNGYYVQAWYRDPPAPKSTNLSNALQFTLTP